MPFRNYCSELVGTIPRLPYPLAQILVNRAWSDIRDMRSWSFLVTTDDLLSASIITSGTVTVTLGSNSVALDSTAAAALSPTALANPPLASPTLGVGRQIRIGTSGSGGPIYNILAADFTGNTLTLDRVYAGTSGAQPYQVYKCYFATPAADFLRYLTITNMQAGYTIRGRKLLKTQMQLNSVDPQRGSTGDAYTVSAYKSDATGHPVHEWYPHPVNAAVYNCVYQKRGTDLSDSNDLPATFPASVLMARAFMHASDWALANVSTYSELAQTNWVMFRQTKASAFKEQLIQAIRQDDELSTLTPFVQGSSFDLPLGGEFLQGHDISSLIGG